MPCAVWATLHLRCLMISRCLRRHICNLVHGCGMGFCCCRRRSMIFSVSSRASLTKFKSVGYLMSAGRQIASTRTFSGFDSFLSESGFPPLSGGGSSSGEESFQANSMIFSLKRLIISVGRRFRKYVIKEVSKGSSI